MTLHVPDPERWADRAPGRASAEDLMGAALRSARAATVPSEALVARVAAGVFDDAPSGFAIHRWRAAAVAFVGLLVLGGTVGAARAPLRVWAARHGLLAPAVPPAAAPARPGPPAPVLRAVTPVVAAAPVVMPAPVDVPAPSPAARPARPVRARVVAVVAEPPAAEEARILKSVFRALRAESGSDRAAAALQALDDYDRRFPAGLLRDEARLARTEALLALGRAGEARALLEAWEATGAVLPRAARDALARLREP